MLESLMFLAGEDTSKLNNHTRAMNIKVRVTAEQNESISKEDLRDMVDYLYEKYGSSIDIDFDKIDESRTIRLAVITSGLVNREFYEKVIYDWKPSCFLEFSITTEKCVDDFKKEFKKHFDVITKDSNYEYVVDIICVANYPGEYSKFTYREYRKFTYNKKTYNTISDEQRLKIIEDAIPYLNYPESIKKYNSIVKRLKTKISKNKI